MDGSYDGSYGQSGDQKKRSVEDADDDAYVACFRAKQRLWRHLEIVIYRLASCGLVQCSQATGVTILGLRVGFTAIPLPSTSRSGTCHR